MPKTENQRLKNLSCSAKRQPAKVRIFREQSHEFFIYEKKLMDKSVKQLSLKPNPVGEEDLNDVADRVYKGGFSSVKKNDYKDALNYIYLKRFKQFLTAGTNQDWVDEIIDKDTEGTTDLLPEQLQGEYDMLRAGGLSIDAENLLVPVGNWRLPVLLKQGHIDKSTTPDPWIIRNCHYSSEIGLEI